MKTRLRGKMCSEVLAFGHTADKQNGTLISCIRVYADGSCTNGVSEYKAGEIEEAAIHYITQLITEDLFCSDVCWPPIEELQPLMEKIPIGDVQTARLENPCIGFECAWRRNGRIHA